MLLGIINELLMIENINKRGLVGYDNISGRFFSMKTTLKIVGMFNAELEYIFDLTNSALFGTPDQISLALAKLDGIKKALENNIS